jgi:hypothetical protein
LCFSVACDAGIDQILVNINVLTFQFC